MSGFSPKICTKRNLENLGGNLCRYFARHFEKFQGTELSDYLQDVS